MIDKCVKIHIMAKLIKGQSLLEVLTAVAIGVIVIGGSVIALFAIIDSAVISGQQQTATFLAEEQLLRLNNVARFNWTSLYDLNKGSANHYHLIPFGAQFMFAAGKEGVLANDLEAGLVGHWKLDDIGNSIAHDYSFNGNNGSINTGEGNYVDGPVGSAWEKDDLTINSAIVVPNSPEIDFDNNDSFSVATWIRVDALLDTNSTHTAVRNSAFYKGNNTNSYGIALQAGNIRAGVRYGSTSRSVQYNINMGSTHHAVLTVDQSSELISLYVNGQLVGTESYDSSQDFSNSDSWRSLSHHGISGNSGSAIRGMVDDIRLYNRSLTQEDVNHLYNTDRFLRYFYVQNVCRSDDSDYEIVGSPPCSGVQIEDPITQRITHIVEWPVRRGGGTSNFVLSSFVTRWQNRVFDQSDWSGGAGFGGPTSETTNRFFDQDGIDFSETGSIRVDGI